MPSDLERELVSMVEGTKDRLFRVACRILADPLEAEDVLQEVYMRAYDKMVAGTRDKGLSWEGFLYRATVNASLDALRRRKGRRAVELSDEEVSTKVGPEVYVLLRELEGFCAELSEEQRTAWVLKELEGHTASEIASLLGTTEGAVEQRLLRARQILKERVQ